MESIWTPCGMKIFHGIHMESTWNPHGFHGHSIWTPCGMKIFHGIHMESTWIPWSLHGHSMVIPWSFHVHSTWIPNGIRDLVELGNNIYIFIYCLVTRNYRCLNNKGY